MNIPSHLKDRIVRLFEQLDQAYDATAVQSGFACNGCEDNCCMTRFHHHTLLEYLYLHEALARLPQDQQEAIKVQAVSVVERMAALARDGEPLRVMCPLNREGRCMLYAHRPMICRLHGIPHRMHRPDGQVLTGPGCDEFYTQCAESGGIRLDRTPLFMAMANLERELRQELGFKHKLKLTIAEMIITDMTQAPSFERMPRRQNEP